MSRPSSLVKIDWLLILPVFILVFISLITLFSVNTAFFKNQAIFFGLSFFVFLFFSHTNYRVLQSYAKGIYILAFLLLLLVLFLGIESRGAVRWFSFYGFQIQFSEICKPFLAITFASYLSHRTNTIKTYVILAFFLFPLLFFIYKQPDLGNALLYLGTVIFTLLFYGLPFRWFFLSLAAGIALVPLSWRFLHTYQQERILTFLHMTHDPLGTSYNAIQSIIAVGSGFFMGKGLGQGTQSGLRFLPERHTDFLFATISEELGFVGSVVIICAFTWLLYRLYISFTLQEDMFSKLFIICTFSLLSLQFFINIGMNIGIVPIVGITLPFVSYGGSSLLSNAILLGIVSSMTFGARRKDVLEIT